MSALPSYNNYDLFNQQNNDLFKPIQLPQDEDWWKNITGDAQPDPAYMVGPPTYPTSNTTDPFSPYFQPPPPPQPPQQSHPADPTPPTPTGPDPHYPANPPPITYPGTSANGYDGGAYQGSNPQPAKPPTAPFYNVSTDSPIGMAQQNRLAAYGAGQSFEDSLRSELDRSNNLESSFLSDVMNSPVGYSNILAGKGGFQGQSATGQGTQMDDLLQQKLLYGGQANENELQQLQYQPYEDAQVKGDPWAAWNSAGDMMGQVDTAYTDMGNKLRSTGANLKNDLTSAIDPTKLQFDPRVAENQKSVLGNSIDEFNQINDPSKLNVDPNFYGGMNNAIDKGSDSFATINDPNRLGVSAEFMDDYKFGPQDTQDLKDQAARYVQLSNAERNAELMRKAASQGNTSALALNAAQNQNQLQSDIASADAMTDAGVQGKGIELGTTKGREDTRLGAEQDIANRSTGFLNSQIQNYLDALKTNESMRMSGARDVADRSTSFLNNNTQQYLDSIRNDEQMRMAGNQDIATRQADAAKANAQFGFNTESKIGDAATQAAQYRINTLTNLQQGADDRQSQRGQASFANRTNALGNSLNTRYTQAADMSNSLANRWNNIYGQQKSEEGEARNALNTMRQNYSDNSRAIWQQRGNNANSTVGNANTATGIATQAQAQPGFWDKLAAGVGGLFGGK